jgi:hypothetical protein
MDQSPSPQELRMKLENMCQRPRSCTMEPPHEEEFACLKPAPRGVGPSRSAAHVGPLHAAVPKRLHY